MFELKCTLGMKTFTPVGVAANAGLIVAMAPAQPAEEHEAEAGAHFPFAVHSCSAPVLSGRATAPL